MNLSQELSQTTCLELNDFLKHHNFSSDGSGNTTREAITAAFYLNYCTPTPYPGLQGITKWIVTIISVVFLIFGLIGNILSATIMHRRARRGLSSYLYLALLALADICVLYTSGLLFLLEIAFDYHPLLQAPIFCRVGFYLQHLFTYISAWLIVAVTFERFVVVRYPFQSILVCRMRVAYTVTLLIFLFFFIYTAHCFFTFDIIQFPIHTEHGFHPNYLICDLTMYRRLLPFLDLCFYSLIPSILILIFNTLIIFTMFYAIKQRRYYLQAGSYLPTTDACPRNLNVKTKSSSSTRTPFFRSRSAGKFIRSHERIPASSLPRVESTPAARSFTSHRRSYRTRLNRTPVQPKSRQILFDSTSATGIRLTCLLLIISFLFVFCTSPIPIRHFFPENRSTMRWQITGLVLHLLMYFNHTVGIFSFSLGCFSIAECI